MQKITGGKSRKTIIERKNSAIVYSVILMQVEKIIVYGLGMGSVLGIVTANAAEGHGK